VSQTPIGVLCIFLKAPGLEAVADGEGVLIWKLKVQAIPYGMYFMSTSPAKRTARLSVHIQTLTQIWASYQDG
jgi:hypothetical protein